MSTENALNAAGPAPRRKGPSTARVLIVSSVMFTFISYWRTAAIVLCDLASTAYYIGGIVESQIGKAAPWFILAVMLFSYGVRSVYIESCSMFVRGGVYRIVKEAMGGGVAKLAVSALMFDYILTGPISGVTAGTYIVGWVIAFFRLDPKTSFLAIHINEISAAIAVAITIYFWRVNVRGMHESSDKALKIMGATTVMGIIMIVWCLATLAVHPDKAQLPPSTPDLSRKVDIENKPVLDPFQKQVDPLGWVGESKLGKELRPEKINGHWWSLIGVIGILIAFGHSILAMSGEETLAQVYREVESPKLPNFKKAAFVVFVYSLLFTSCISFFAVMIIPDGERMSIYSGNLIGGLAMNMIGPYWARLALNALVVFIGFLILSGAVNTAIIGSNGVLNRVAEDGVLPDWFLKPHKKYGTTASMLNLVVGLQIFTIIASRGNVLTLGEAYAFGVVWSFVFNAMSMLILRFKKPEKREYEVPLNFKIGKYDAPVGIALIFLTLFSVAIVNFMTKEVATITGVIFTVGLFLAFMTSERVRERRTGETHAHHEHLEQFNEDTIDEITPKLLGIDKPYRKLVAIRSPHNLSMLETCLNETDPETTDVIVMTANVIPVGGGGPRETITDQDRALLTAVVNLAEHAGKPVRPLIAPTNEPFFALARTAHALGVQELIMGVSNKFDPHVLLDQVALYWMNVCKTQPEPLTIRVLGDGRDARLDIAGGSQIPKLGERAAEAERVLTELRASQRGIRKLLLAHEGGPLSADFLDTVLSFLDPAIEVSLIHVLETGPLEHAKVVAAQAVDRAQELGKHVASSVISGNPGPEIVAAARAGNFDAIFMSLRGDYRKRDTMVMAPTVSYVLQHAPCRVILGFPPESMRAPELREREIERLRD